MTDQKVPYSDLVAAIASTFPDLTHEHAAIAESLVALCQIEAGSSEIAPEKYNKALVLMELVKTRQATDLVHANDIVENRITEVSVPPIPDGGLTTLSTLSVLGADKLAHKIGGVNQHIDNRVLTYYVASLLGNLPAALERVEVKKPTDGIDASVVELVDRLLGLGPASDAPKALPESES